MADKQNCSEPKVNSSIARRRATLPMLSRILKSQTSSYQHRAGPTPKTKTSGGGVKMFLVKAVIGCGAVYLSAIMGIWGEAEESKQICAKIKRFVSDIDNQKALSGNMQTNITEKFNKSKDYIKNSLESIPEELKAYYEKSEKYISDLIKGK